jgi:hypothetical protein
VCRINTYGLPIGGDEGNGNHHSQFKSPWLLGRWRRSGLWIMAVAAAVALAVAAKMASTLCRPGMMWRRMLGIP